MVDKINDLDRQKARRHRKLEKSLVIEVEESVQRVTCAVRNFTNPFTVADKNRHYSMTSGAPVPMEIEMDVLRAEAAGMAAKGDFIGRLQSGEPGRFFDPIKKKIHTWRLATRWSPSHHYCERQSLF